MTYDIAIIGSGPAAYSASIYASRYKLTNIILGKTIGGTISEAHKVCNYPGIPDISGLELGVKMEAQAKEQGAVVVYTGVKDVKRDKDTFKIYSDNGEEYESKTVILATGTERNKLLIPNEDKYIGKGLTYCATCDAMFYKNKTVAVIGGSNAAVMSAVMLSDIASKVYVIYRGDELRSEPVWIDQLLSKANVEVLYKTLIVELSGEERLEKIKLSNKYKDSEYLEIDGLFVEIGSEPNSDLPMRLGLNIDEKGYINVDKSQATNIPGIWAAGDCTNNSNSFRQVVTATSEGAIASNAIYKYLKERV